MRFRITYLNPPPHGHVEEVEADNWTPGQVDHLFTKRDGTEVKRAPAAEVRSVEFIRD